MKKEITLGQAIIIGITLMGTILGFWLNTSITKENHEVRISHIEKTQGELKTEIKGLRVDLQQYNESIIRALNNGNKY